MHRKNNVMYNNDQLKCISVGPTPLFIKVKLFFFLFLSSERVDRQTNLL